MSKIYIIINIIYFWIKKLGYSVKSMELIRFSYIVMSEKNKSLTTNTFAITDNQNTKYIIFIKINVYSMGINNLDIKPII